MILGDALQRATTIFNEHNIDDSSLESRVLLKHITKLTTTEVYLHPETPLNQQQIDSFHYLVKRRLNGEPTAYITNSREFYGINFFVDHRVLIPRPETELIVEKALSLIQGRKGSSFIDKSVTVADIGTGCGNIAISLAMNINDINIYATDISNMALEVAMINAKKYSVLDTIHFSQGDLTSSVIQPVDILVANLPYISSAEIARLPATINCYEPKLAIDGGIDGLVQIKRLLLQLKDMIKPSGKAILEMGYNHKEALSSFISANLPETTFDFFSDFSNITRVVQLSF